MADNKQNRKTLLPKDVIRARIRRFNIRSSLWETLLKLIVILVAIYLLLTVFYGVAIVPDEAMKPSLRQGDLSIFNRLDKSADLTDVIAYVDDGQIRYARVVAQSGDIVDINEEGQLIVNGQAQARDNQAIILSERGTVTYPVQVAQDEVFVLNDNDENTTDSRTLGPLQNSQIVGKLLMIMRRRSF